LNNFYFSGHQLWKDYSEIYKAWGEKLNIQKISILGGEPLLNPSIIEWMSGLRKIWPTSTMEVASNGTRINFVNGLYENLLENRIELRISAHNKQRRKEIIQLVNNNFLKSPISKKYSGDFSNWIIGAYNKVKDESWPNCQTIEDFYHLSLHIQKECKDIHKIDPENYLEETSKLILLDKNKVKVSVDYSENFATAPLLYNKNAPFTVYNSDPAEAHKVCISKYCPHFIKGKFYKCHHVALLPEFMQQFSVDISDENKELLNSYQPLTLASSDHTIREFIADIRNEIPQCKLCPSEQKVHYFQSDTNKIKIIKRKNKHEVQKIR